jgi:hypothetical protein
MLVSALAFLLVPALSSADRLPRQICTQVHVRIVGYDVVDWDPICLPPCMHSDCYDAPDARTVRARGVVVQITTSPAR